VVLPSGGGCRVAVKVGKRRGRANKTRDKTVLRQVAGNGPLELRSRSRATRSPFQCDKIPVPARDKLTLIPPIASRRLFLSPSTCGFLGIADADTVAAGDKPSFFSGVRLRL
jgi:hypothetical protein